MARRRKVESKAPTKPQSKSVVRKSTRQKAKKQQEDGEVNGDINSEAANNSENFKNLNDTNVEELPSKVNDLNESKPHEQCINKDISVIKLGENTNEQSHENYSRVNVASIEKFELSSDKPTIVNDNILNQAVSPDDEIEETTIYEEMEIETESTVDYSIMPDRSTIEQIIHTDDSYIIETHTLECSEMENKITSNSTVVSPSDFDKSLSTNYDSANSNSYQMVEKGLSGLHMSDAEISELSKDSSLTQSEINCKGSNVSFDNFNDFEIAQNEKKMMTRNAKAKKFASTLVKSSKKDNDYRKKKVDRPIEQNYDNTDNKSLDTESKEKIGGKYECIEKDNRTLIINDILSENTIEYAKLISTLANEKMVDDKQSVEKPKPITIEEHSMDSEINSKLDFEDAKLSSSSENSSDILLSKTSGMSDLNIKIELDKQCESNNDKTGIKNRSEDSDAIKSDSGSNNSGVRRSNRIKHIGLRKQRSRGRGLVVKPSQESQKVQPERDKLISTAATVPEQQVNQIAKNMKNIFEMQFDNEIPKCTVVPQDNLNPLLSNTSVINSDSNSNKPVKVKSRWRRSSELEMGNSTSWSAPQSNVAVNFTGTDVSVEDRFNFINNTINKELDCHVDSLHVLQVLSKQESNTTNSLEDIVTNEIRASVLSNNLSSTLSMAVISNIVGAKISLPMVAEIDREMEERLSQFEHLKENLYLTERYTNKETKRMVCDCFLTEEEIQRGELGCGEDCLNRLLMIECGSRCIVGDRCTNRRFQNCNYANCEVFRTEKKGFGLRAITDLNAGDFIMEYVGEVVDSKDFRRRAKEYSKDKNRHYYFMALKSDQIIDATMKGNISRFINHSCDPNAETQKWTVNGELRIGFFNKKFVAAGEEITFDYHFQRYGKEAQKCFCEAANCRGWIGDNPEDSKSNEEECMEDNEIDTEDEFDEEENEEDEDKKEKPEKPVRRRRSKREDKKIIDHMEDEDLEEQIDRLCASGLKNRVHTLTLSRLMVRCRELQHRRRLLKVIQSGEQPCRRLFLDYHGLRLMWSYMMDVAGSDTEEAHQFRLEIVKTLMTLPIPNRTMLIDSKVLSIVEKWSKQLYHSPNGDSPDDEQSKLKLTSEEVEMKEIDKDNIEVKKEGDTSVVASKAILNEQLLVSELASNLLESWSNLKEVFRIPKKERLEQMKEHEREADRGYKEDVEKEARETLSYERHRSERYRGELDKRPDRRPIEERTNLVQVPRMSKFERRQLFALKVAKEEEERQRRQQEELWQQHQAQCMALGVDPYATAALDPQSGYPLYFDPQLAQWQAYPGQEGTLYQQQQQQQQQPSFSHLPPSVLNGSGTVCPPRTDCEPEISAALPPADSEQPPPALDLPPKWKWARDKRGRVYYYHTKERVSQWLPPPPDHIGLQPDSGPESSSDESSDESVSSRDNDEDDEDDVGSVVVTDDTENTYADASERDDPDEEEVDEPLLVDEQSSSRPQQQKQLSLTTSLESMDLDPPVVKAPDNKKSRRDGLVQERIISPRREEDRVDHSKFKDLKDKLRRQKEKSRLKEHLQSEKNRKHRRSAKSKSHVKQSQVKSFQNISSDMSPTSERKIKDTFRINMAHVMVHFLNPYRKNDCKQGRITNTEDFKYLARKLTHFVLAKELKHCKSVDELECNDNVKHKAKDFVRKYMNKFGAVYQRDKDED